MTTVKAPKLAARPIDRGLKAPEAGSWVGCWSGTTLASALLATSGTLSARLYVIRKSITLKVKTVITVINVITVITVFNTNP